MSDDKDIENALLWAEKITRNKQNGDQKKKETFSNFKLALYLLLALAVICIVGYLVYRAYRIPDPPSIIQEVNNMINHIEAN